MNRSHQDGHNSTCIKHRLTMSRHGRSLKDFCRHKADGIAVLLFVFVKTLLQQAGEEHLGTLEKQLDSLEDDVAWPKDAKANRSCV